MVRILLAQKINQVMGGVAVLPWEVERMPDEWLMAFEMMSDDLPKMQEGYQKLDDAFKRTTARFEQRQ